MTDERLAQIARFKLDAYEAGVPYPHNDVEELLSALKEAEEALQQAEEADGFRKGVEAAIGVLKKMLPGRYRKDDCINALCSLRDGLLSPSPETTEEPPCLTPSS